MDISELFGQSFMGPYNTTIQIHGDLGGEFVDGIVEKEMLGMSFQKVRMDLHVYPFNPTVVKDAVAKGLCVVGVWKSDRDFDKDVPSLISFCTPTDDQLEELIAEDIDSALLDCDLYAFVYRR